MRTLPGFCAMLLLVLSSLNGVAQVSPEALPPQNTKHAIVMFAQKGVRTEEIFTPLAAVLGAYFTAFSNVSANAQLSSTEKAQENAAAMLTCEDGLAKLLTANEMGIWTTDLKPAIIGQLKKN